MGCYLMTMKTWVLRNTTRFFSSGFLFFKVFFFAMLFLHRDIYLQYFFSWEPLYSKHLCPLWESKEISIKWNFALDSWTKEQLMLFLLREHLLLINYSTFAEFPAAL